MNGNDIKDIRLNNCLTQSEFANKLGVSCQCVSLWERNERHISLKMIRKICEIFEVKK